MDTAEAESARELRIVQSEGLNLQSSIETRPDLKPLVEALLARLRHYHIPNPQTPSEWMARAITVFATSLATILSAGPGQEKKLPWSMTGSSYTLPAGHLLNCFNPLCTGRGWVSIMENTLKLIRQDKELCQPSSQAMTPYRELHPDSSTVIKSLFLSIGNLLKRTEIQTIMLNINFAAIHMALLRAGILEYQSTYEAFRKDVEAVIKQTDLDWDSFETFRNNYKTGVTLQLPLHLALAISPIMLLRKMQLWNLSVNREHLFTIARGLNPNPPILLRRINGAIWRSLIKISEGTMTARGLLYDLYQEFSEEDLRSVSDIDAHFFNPASTPVLVQESASSDCNLQHAPDPSLVAASSPPAVSSAPPASTAYSDCLSSTSLVNALNLAKAANTQTSLDAGECLQPETRKEGQSIVSSSRPSNTIFTPIRPQSDVPPATLATSFTEDVIMAGLVETPNPTSHKKGTAYPKPKRKLSDAEVPDIKSKPAPQAVKIRISSRLAAAHVNTKTSSMKKKGGKTVPKKKYSKKAAKRKAREGIESEKEENIGSEVESEEDAMPGMVKSEEDQSVGHNYVLCTDRPRSTEDPVDIYSHDGKSVFRFQPDLFSKTQHELLRSIINRVNQQEGRAKCNDSVSVNEWVDLTTPVPGPQPSPVYETTYHEWLGLSSSHQQSIFKTQSILLRNCPIKSRQFNLETFREILGNVDTLRTMHDLQEPLPPKDVNSESDSDESIADDPTSINNVHVQATYRNMVETAEKRTKILNGLSISAVGKSPVPPGSLFTGNEAEGHTLGTAGFSAFVRRAWREWALAAIADAIHHGHIDCNGLLTYISVVTGIKGWIIADPVNRHDLGSLDAFGDGYDVDLQNSQNWRLYSLLLRPGDWFIMRPCVPHLVLTLQDCICLGGHDYCSQTFPESAYGIFHAFTGSDFLTNTHHLEAIECQQRIIAYYYEEIVHFEGTFEEQLAFHGNVEKEDGGHIIPHLPNFNFIDDVVGYLFLHNIVQLGNILD
ncbi:hypothetical protein BT96DRAFT_950921, partial [Gymnopus androsaceus JB14]